MRRTERETTVVTCTRRAATRINDLALQVLFADTHRAPMDVIPADYESNTDNFDGHGTLRDDRHLAPLHFQLYKGSKVFLTKNLNKRRVSSQGGWRLSSRAPISSTSQSTPTDLVSLQRRTLSCQGCLATKTPFWAASSPQNTSCLRCELPDSIPMVVLQFDTHTYRAPRMNEAEHAHSQIRSYMAHLAKWLY